MPNFIFNKDKVQYLFAEPGEEIKILEKEYDARIKKLTGPIFLFSFLTTKFNGDRYSKIKQFVTKHAIHAQAINLDKHSYEGLSGPVLGNIMKQFLNKMNELCWWINISKYSPIFNNKPVMLVGIDVYHGVKKFVEGNQQYRQKRSISAAVAIIWDGKGNYTFYSDINPERARKEVLGSKLNEVKGDTVLQNPEKTESKFLKKFIDSAIKSSKLEIDSLFIMRDGVADNQVDEVEKSEYSQVKEAVNNNVKITYLVIQKRIATKFFLEREGSNEMENPPPGLMVNSIQHAFKESFYLSTTTSRISTVKPVHYIIVKRHKDHSLDLITKLTYGLCYMYPNWAGPIKLPVPTQLAHKLAFLVGDLDATNEKDSTLVVHNLMKNFLWYL